MKGGEGGIHTTFEALPRRVGLGNLSKRGIVALAHDLCRELPQKSTDIGSYLDLGSNELGAFLGTEQSGVLR